VENDAQLARGLQLEAVEGLTREQQESFRQLEAALENHGQRIEETLGGLLEVAVQAHDEVIGVRVAVQAQGEQLLALQGQVQQVPARLQMRDQPVRAQHSLSIQSDRELKLVRELLARYRALPEKQRHSAALLCDVGKLQVAVGDFDGAQTSFTTAATLTPDARARAEAHYNAYRTALERDDFDIALTELRWATALDPGRFAAFPGGDYEPVRILGAGGFGVTFLCRLKLSGGLVAVKALAADDLDRDAGTVMREAAALDELNHPGIVRLRHCGYADTGRTLPYLVMEYF